MIQRTWRWVLEINRKAIVVLDVDKNETQEQAEKRLEKRLEDEPVGTYGRVYKVLWWE